MQEEDRFKNLELENQNLKKQLEEKDRTIRLLQQQMVCFHFCLLKLLKSSILKLNNL